MGAERVLNGAAEAYRVALGTRLVAAYALGSLAHGGFSELVSDIDLGLVINDPLLPGDAEAIQAVANSEKSKGSTLHERLSVFWGTPSTLRGEQDGGRFPAPDRLDLLENGHLLVGTDDARRGLPTPSAIELLIAGAEFALDHLAGIRRGVGLLDPGLGSFRPAGESAVDEIRSPELLVSRGVRRVTKLVLFPVRFLYTAASSRVATNDAAVAHYLESESAPSKTLVVAAHAWRTVPAAEDKTAVELLRQELIPLYLHYIDDHSERLSSIGESDLAGAFLEWRGRLAG